MACVTILPLRVQVELKAGERLLDALDEAERPSFRTACRAGNCGACRLSVLEGAAAFRPPSAREYTTLLQLKAAADERLGCQLALAEAPMAAAIEIVLSLPLLNLPRRAGKLNVDDR